MGARMSLPADFRKPPNPAIARDFVELEIDFSEFVNKEIKRVPGVVWGPSIGGQKRWHVARDVQPVVAQILKSLGYFEPAVSYVSPPNQTCHPLNGEHPWQTRGAQLLMNEGYGALMFSPGLGKSRPAIRAGRSVGRMLWVCPAMTRLSIAREVAHWWPEAQVGIVGDKKRPTKGADAVIVSYQGLERVMESEADFQAVVVDEFHNVKNKKAVRSKQVRQIIETQKPSMLALLSGTPIPNRPHDLWNPLDMMCPRRFGSEWLFQERYSIIGHNGYGRTIGGLNPAYSEELAARLDYIGVRATEKDAIGHLPPLNLVVEWQDANEMFQRDVAEIGNSERELQQFMAKTIDMKAKWAAEALTQEMEAGRKTALLTWHREVAERVARSIGVRAIHGGTPPQQRDALLNELAADPEAPLVCTMASISEGLNQLVAWRNGIMAETYYRPASVIQALKRFHRLTSTDLVTFRVLGLTNSPDERIIANLLEKVGDMNQVIRAGATEEALGQIVEQTSYESMLESWEGGAL